ncbi:TetR family transcriptional regulator C-terminal domain-containing protein [Streptomyces sp. NPDC000410]|uniref:TetR/AcrR family transcriptional regulator n=1 Tax=Streptomyces sp. NPDC000410 TaxID=3154254 RepID=UPI00332E506E
MPKKVDHEERRREISQALWRIASTRGLDGVSLRDVAAEAGVSLGRLQYYFRSRDEMLVFALRQINQLADQRIRERIEKAAAELTEQPPPRFVLRECLAGMLPLDEHSRIGQLVAAAYFARAVHDERLRGEAREGIPKLRDFFAGLLRQAAERGELPTGRDFDEEAMILISLVDGLTAYTLLHVHTPEEALRLLDRHLDRLFEPGAARQTGL